MWVSAIELTLTICLASSTNVNESGFARTLDGTICVDTISIGTTTSIIDTAHLYNSQRESDLYFM